MDLASKLQLKSGQRLAVLGGRAGAGIDLDQFERAPDLAFADALIAIAPDRQALDSVRADIAVAARRDVLVWVVYPKAGQLGTDLNRDFLARALADDGLRPVRQISVDGVWSALRFRTA
jgi:hypothetical protein